ncbi:MAG: ATP-binding protein [Myxococcales bacterium]
MTKSDPTAISMLGEPTVPSDPDLLLMPCAVAILDADLRLLRANEAFLDLCVDPRPGAMLAALLKPASGQGFSLVGDGDQVELLACAVSGEPVNLKLRRNGEQVGAIATRAPLDTADAPLAKAMHDLAEQEHERDALLSLSRELALAASEDELVAAIAHCVRRLFPGRYFCVRIVDSRQGALTSMYAEGRLIEGGRERMAMRNSAADKARLDPRALPVRVELTDEEPLIFAGARQGFATPLAAAGQFFGLINLEYPPNFAADLGRDEKLVIQLANQASVGVRNAKLIEELTFVRKYLEELIENANALILVANRQREIIVFNRALVELTDLPRSEVIGKPLDMLLVEGERDGLLKVFARSVGGEKVSHFETLIKVRSGAERRVTFNTAPIVNPTGEVEGVIAIGQDLSRQKELERRVVQAEKLATLGQLAAGVAHEINNPLSTITMYTDAMLQLAQVRKTDPADLDKLRRIKESADRILKFARDLTGYAKPAGTHPEEIDVHDLLDQAARYCEHVLKQSGAMIARSYGAVPKVRAVRSSLVQVFVNLITNACHALPPTGGRVELGTKSREGGVEIEVRDSGSGIKPQDLPRIFDPFFTTKPEGHGTGLGLTIVQSIVEKHGGTIHVTSVMGDGTCFTVWLPVNPER